VWSPENLFSQNFEDLYLQRLFSGVEKGFYIDVGAWHPIQDSVTAIFYEQGWRGINIEPVKEIFSLLQAEREEDVNLCLAVLGDPEAATAALVVMGTNPCQWGHHHVTTSHLAEQGSAAASDASSTIRLVPASTLSEIINKYAYSQQINFIKLDVEGLEYEVLLGLNLSKLRRESRPQVILLEVTLPNTRLSSPHRQQCRDLLEENSYQHLYFDGLNDYYCEKSLHHIFEPLMLPPNVFDKPSIVAKNMFSASGDVESALSEVRSLRKDLMKAFGDLSTEAMNTENAFQRIGELENQLAQQAILLQEERETSHQINTKMSAVEKSLAELKDEREVLASKLRKIRHPRIDENADIC